MFARKIDTHSPSYLISFICGEDTKLLKSGIGRLRVQQPIPYIYTSIEQPNGCCVSDECRNGSDLSHNIDKVQFTPFVRLLQAPFDLSHKQMSSPGSWRCIYSGSIQSLNWCHITENTIFVTFQRESRIDWRLDRTKSALEIALSIADYFNADIHSTQESDGQEISSGIIRKWTDDQGTYHSMGSRRRQCVTIDPTIPM